MRKDVPADAPPDSSREEKFLRSFVREGRRERYMGLIASPKRRTKFLERLAHTLEGELEPGCAFPIKPSAHSPNEIATLLESRVAPKECYIISEDGDLDARVMDLRSALAQVVGYGMGTILRCTPSLAYYEAEGPGERFLLLRPATKFPYH